MHRPHTLRPVGNAVHECTTPWREHFVKTAVDDVTVRPHFANAICLIHLRNIVDHQVNRPRRLGKGLKKRQVILKNRCIEPIIRIQKFDESPLRLRQAPIDATAVVSVRLIDHAKDIRIHLGEGMPHFARPIRRAVVDN